jgi:hypothetical protein
MAKDGGKIKNQKPMLLLGDDFDTAVVQGAGIKVELNSNGNVVVHTNGTVEVRPAAANDTVISAAKASLEVGAKMADGSVFAGLTTDSKQQIFAMPTDLDITMTFNDAAKSVEKLNANKFLGHSDWQIPTLENLYVLQKNQNEGALKGTFKTAAANRSVYPVWYWSSSQDRVYPSLVRFVRFDDGDDGADHKDIRRLSCRPVRLVAVSAAPGAI